MSNELEKIVQEEKSEFFLMWPELASEGARVQFAENIIERIASRAFEAGRAEGRKELSDAQLAKFGDADNSDWFEMKVGALKQWLREASQDNS